MQHMVSLVQLGVLSSVRAGGVLHCSATHHQLKYTNICIKLVIDS